MKIISKSEVETRALAERLAGGLRGLDLLCLVGELGSGKTTFTQGLAKGLGCRGRVQSPTFVLARVYRGAGLTLNHLDLYRVAPGETGEIGIEDYLDDPRAVCVVEWPASGVSYFPRDFLEVRFAHGGHPAQRSLVFSGKGPRSRALIKGFK